MNPIDVTGIQALTFDCYGTLIDWQAGITGALAPIFPTVAPKDIIKAFSQLEREIESGPWISYRSVCADVVRRMATQYGQTLKPGQERILAASIKDWPAFPDTSEALRKLHTRYKLAVVSNIDRDVFVQGTLPRLGIHFDQVITTEDVRSYKPNPAHFHEAARRLKIPFSQILHVAESRFHDIEPANALGIRCVLVERQKSGPTASGPGKGTPDLTVRTLTELVDVLHA